MIRHHQLYATRLQKTLSSAVSWPARYWRCGRWHKTVVLVLALLALCIGTMYGIARWYMAAESSKPLALGVSFVPDYAKSLGLNPADTLNALLNGLQVKHLRLVSYWSDMEPSPGQYDFTELDHEFVAANAAHAKVSLAVGLRQPRWPECHAPAWIDSSRPESIWYPQLKTFMAAVIDRYKANPALDSYQLENEYFLTAFGQCHNYDRGRLVDEYALVKRLDPNHPVIISRSNNALGIPIGRPTPDEFGVSIYRRVWSPPFGRYVEYPFPAWFYGFLAGAEKLADGKDTIVHEMQAEPWPRDSQPITSSSLAEQSQTLDANRLKERFSYAKATGMKTIDMWGAEYWYYRWQVEGDKSVWNTARQAFQAANQQNPNL